jgi:hypothetical protein
VLCLILGAVSVISVLHIFRIIRRTLSFQSARHPSGAYDQTFPFHLISKQLLYSYWGSLSDERADL